MRIKKETSPRHIPAIDLLGTLAILMVMAGHLKPTLPLPSEAFRWGWDHFQRTSHLGVYLFFLVSGFLITRIIDLGPGGVLQPGWKYFYVRRSARILPLFFLHVLLGLIFVFLLADGSKKFNYCFKLPDPAGALPFWISLFTFSYNWASALFSSLWKGVGHHWALFWSLSIEEQFYLFYPLVLGFLGSVERILVFLALVMFLSFGGNWGLSVLLPGLPVEVGVYTMAYGMIALGGLLYFTVKHFGSFFSRRKKAGLGVMLAGLFALLPVYFFDFEGLNNYLIAFGGFLFLLGGIHLPFFQTKALKPLFLPGRYSYGNYLFHITVLYFIHSFLWNLNIVIAFLLFTTVTTAIAAVSFHYFETPANHFVRRLFGAKT